MDRYPADREWRRVVESPDEAWAAALRVDLGRFMRTRFAAYVNALADMAHDNGIRDIPLLVNVHGTEGGNGVPLAIGISQLVETYAGAAGLVAGSDHYLGEMSLDTTTDVHFVNACLAAVNGPDQPVTSLEFEAGTGDYGGGAERLYDPSTTDLKTRLFLAQGNRMVNYYLLTGGINPPLDVPVGDGNDRISFTGERHGTAAPIGPLGERGLAFAGTARAAAAVTANGRVARRHGRGARRPHHGAGPRRLHDRVPPPRLGGDEPRGHRPRGPPWSRPAQGAVAVPALRRLPVRGGRTSRSPRRGPVVVRAPGRHLAGCATAAGRPLSTGGGCCCSGRPRTATWRARSAGCS